MKVLRINDTLHNKLKTAADADGRTLQWFAEKILNDNLNGAHPAGNTNPDLAKVHTPEIGFGSTPPGPNPFYEMNIPTTKKRTVWNISNDIAAAEHERDQLIEEAEQDPETQKKIWNDWENTLTTLRAELKEAQA